MIDGVYMGIEGVINTDTSIIKQPLTPLYRINYSPGSDLSVEAMTDMSCGLCVMSQ